MNEAELTRIVEELSTWVGQPMTGAWQPRRDRVVLGVGRSFLLLVPRGPHARVHAVTSRPRNPGNPFSFQGACRAHLRVPLRDVTKTPGDRVVTLRFGDNDLQLRLTGRSGGLWILRGEDVLAAYDGPAPARLPGLPPPPSAPRQSEIRFAIGPDQGASAAAAAFFGRRERETLRAERRRVVTKRLKTRLARERRLQIALEQDLAKAERAPEARSRADALAARLHEVTRGQTVLDVPDLSEPDVIHTLTLDPRRSPGQNLEHLYNRARRLERMGDRVLEHMDAVEARRKALEAALSIVDDADDATLGKLERLAPSVRRQRAVAATDEPWFTWLGPKDQTVLVGKNAKGNRRLTFQRARGDDVWLHIRGKPGAHLLIPMQKGKTAALESLMAAAQIALVHAKVLEGESADVQYTRARHVRSIKGAEDGRVQVHAERVLHVTRDPSQLVGWRRADLEHFDVDALAAVTAVTAGAAEGTPLS